MTSLPAHRRSNAACPTPPNQLATGAAGLAIIRRFEHFSEIAYLHRQGYHAIGYGHRLRPGESIILRAPIARAEAEVLLEQDLLPIELYLNATTPVVLAQHQFDALVSLIFDYGIRAFERSPLRSYIHKGESASAVAAIYRFRDHTPAADPSYPAHLRRDAEARLFIGPPAK